MKEIILKEKTISATELWPSTLYYLSMREHYAQHTHLLLLHPCLGHTLSPGSCFTQLVGLFLFSVLLLVGGICAVLAHFLRHSCCPPPLQLALTGTYTLTLEQQPIGRSYCHYVINRRAYCIGDILHACVEQVFKTALR